jgi:hypothetical protein
LTVRLLAKRRRAAYGCTVGPEGSPVGLRMQTRNEKFFTLFSKAGSNVVERAAILMDVVAAPHEGWAKLAKGMLDTEPAGDDTALYLCSDTLISLMRGSVTNQPK